MNPNYNPFTLDHDVCLLRLNNTVITSRNVEIVEIADKSPPTGTIARVTGWGQTSGRNRSLPKHLQAAFMNIMSSTECNQLWKDYLPVTQNMICGTNSKASGCNVSENLFLT